MFSLRCLHKYGIEVLGTEESYCTWLSTPNENLGGVRPDELLVDLDGLEMVIRQLYNMQSVKERSGSH